MSKKIAPVAIKELIIGEEKKLVKLSIVSPLEWKQRKVEILPWAVFDKALPVQSMQDADSSVKVDGRVLNAVWVCRMANCPYFYCQYEGMTLGKEVYNKMMQHVKKEDHFKVWVDEKKSVSNPESEAKHENNPADSSVPAPEIILKRRFVKAILQSGQPYSTFTREGPIYNFFRDQGYTTVSYPTFRNIALRMTEDALSRIAADLRGQLIIVGYDSSPALDRRNFLTVNAYYITDALVYKKTNIGCLVIDGVLNGKDYQNLLMEIFSSFELEAYDWTGDLSVLFDSKKGIVCGGVSDMGAGLFQATARIHGESARGSCAAHGVNNITIAAANASEAFKNALTAAYSLSKAVRLDRDLRRQALEQKLPIPGNPAKERWTRISSAANFVTKHWTKVQELDGIPADIKCHVSTAEAVLKMSKPLLDILDWSRFFLQLSGPMSALIQPFHLLSIMNRLKRHDVPLETLAPMKTLLLNRFARRFFFSSLEGCEYSYGDSDTTRKGNLFSNTFVLAAWALSPCFNFSALVKLNYKTPESALALQLKAEEELLKIHKLVDPSFFAECEFVAGDSIDDLVHDEAAVSPEDRHRKQRDSFRTNKIWDSAFRKFTIDMYNEAKVKDARSLLFSEMWRAAKALVDSDSSAKWIHKVLRLVMAWPGTTVDCERDFSWLQGLLTEYRLSTGDEMVVASMMAKLNPAFMMPESFTEKPKTFSEMQSAERIAKKKRNLKNTEGSKHAKIQEENASAEQSSVESERVKSAPTSSVENPSAQTIIELQDEPDRQEPAEFDDEVEAIEMTEAPNGSSGKKEQSAALHVGTVEVEESHTEKPPTALSIDVRRTQRQRKINPKYESFFKLVSGQKKHSQKIKEEYLKEEGVALEEPDESDRDAEY